MIGHNIQLRSILINTRHQQRHTKRPAHNTLLPLRPFPEPYRQIANTLRAALHPQRLVVMESVALALNAGVLDHGARVRLQTGHGASDVSVYFYYFFDGGGLEEGGGDAFFHAEDYAGARGHLWEGRVK